MGNVGSPEIDDRAPVNLGLEQRTLCNLSCKIVSTGEQTQGGHRLGHTQMAEKRPFGSVQPQAGCELNVDLNRNLNFIDFT